MLFVAVALLWCAIKRKKIADDTAAMIYFGRPRPHCQKVVKPSVKKMKVPVASPPREYPSQYWLNNRATWLAWVLSTLGLHFLLLIMPFFSTPTVWTLTHVIHNSVSFDSNKALWLCYRTCVGSVGRHLPRLQCSNVSVLHGEKVKGLEIEVHTPHHCVLWSPSPFVQIVASATLIWT